MKEFFLSYQSQMKDIFLLGKVFVLNYVLRAPKLQISFMDMYTKIPYLLGNFHIIMNLKIMLILNHYC